MRLTPRVLRAQRSAEVCGERRPRRHGYQLRCLEPVGHGGPHRWTPELLDGRARRDPTRPALVRRLGELLDRTDT